MIQATFTENLKEATTEGLTQWDYGQTLAIAGLSLPTTFQVHFTCKRDPEAIVRVGTTSNNVGTVAIPDKVLEQDTPVTAWVYLVGENSGITIRIIHIPIQPRKKPQNFISDISPSEQTLFETFMQEVNNVVDGVVSDQETLENNLSSHAENKNNPHEVTLEQIGAASGDHAHDLGNTSEIVGTLPIERGGTNSTNGADALNALGIIYSATTPEAIPGRIWLKPITGG